MGKGVRLLALLAALAIAASGCSMLSAPQDKTRDWSAQRLYRAAKESLQNGDYETAIDYYEKLESRYPFGRLAEQAQLDVAYAYYKADEPASAVAAAERFIKLHPSHPNVDYAYYLKGLANFDQGKNLIDRIVKLDESARDTGAATQAFADFRDLTERFPSSRYAKDARQRMLYLKNMLAAHEIHVARYYVKREAYVAAANRARYVVENYPTTPSVPEALAIMVKAYRLLKLDDLADDALRVLRLNYPNDPQLAEAERFSAR